MIRGIVILDEEANGDHIQHKGLLRVKRRRCVCLGVGIVLWGIGMGAQESIMKAAVSSIVPATMRSTGFGIFETGFGIAWFLGSWLLGALYDANPVWLVAVSVSVQLLAIVFYGICIKKQKNETTK